MSTLNVHYRSCCPLLPAVCIVCIVTVQERSRRGGRRERWGRRQLCSSDDHAPPRSNMLYTCDPDHAEQEPRCNENQADYKLPCCDLCATRPAGCHRDERLRSSSVTCRSSVTCTRAALSNLRRALLISYSCTCLHTAVHWKNVILALESVSNKVPVTLNPSIPLHAQTTPWLLETARVRWA